MKTTKQRTSQIIEKTKKITKLRKRIVSLCLSFVMVCSVGLTLGFVLFKQNFNISTDFTQYTMQISDAKGIGLEKTQDNQVRLVKQVDNGVQTYSTKLDHSVYEEVMLKKEKSEYGVKLGDLNAEIYKMKVVGNFTFVSYISSNLRKNIKKFDNYYMQNTLNESCICKSFNLYSGEQIIDRLQGVPDNFDLVGYKNSDFIKSYIVDNSTGKIYSTELFDQFEIQDDLIKVKYYRNSGDGYYNYYKYFVNNENNLEIVALIPNSDIFVKYIHKSPDNVYYVFNESINLYDSQNKFYYINTKLIGSTSFCIGSDGYLYQLTDVPLQSKLQRFVNGQLTSIQFNTNITFKVPAIKEYTNYRRRGIYSLYNNIGFISDCENVYENNYYESSIYNFETKERIYPNQNSQNINFSNNDYLILLENNKILIKRSSNVLSYADFNIATGEITNENILLNDCTLKIGQTTLVNGVFKTLSYTITVTTTNETKIYEAEVVNNTVQIKLIEHEIAQGEVFIIEPIN